MSTDRPENWLSGIWGDATKAAAVKLPESAQRRIDRLARRDGTMRDGVRLPDLATGIAMALRKGDRLAAEQLAQSAVRLFGSPALVMAIGQASQELELASLQAEQEAQARRGGPHYDYPIAEYSDANGHDAETYDDLEDAWRNEEPR